MLVIVIFFYNAEFKVHVLIFMSFFLLWLLLLVPPKLIGKDNSLIDRNPTNTHVVVNHTASFFCPIEGDPTPVVTWKRNGEDLLGDGERIFIWDEGRNLTIAYADVSDTARYTCVATNKAGETDKSFNLEVQGKWRKLFVRMSLLHCTCTLH